MSATLWRSIGVLAGAAGGAAGGWGIVRAFESGAGFAAIAVGVLAGVTIGLYLLARSRSNPATKAGQFMPGLLLGMNTAINVAILWALVGPVAAFIVCAIPLLATIAPVAQSDIYQAPLGWVNWLLPMSWPIYAIGVFLLIVTGLGALLGLAIRTDFLKVHRFKLDFKTGTIGVLGGVGGNVNLASGSPGYNVGIAYMRNVGGYQKTAEELAELVEHEAGHTLNLAIWGWIVHLVGALDENVFGGGHHAYTELFAESNVPNSDHAGPDAEGKVGTFPMWSTQGMPAAPAGT